MRKAVKLAAVSTIAAVAMVGASATAATANDGWDDGDKIGVNVCGNKAESGLAADRLGEIELDDNDNNAFFENVTCQNGKDNFSFNENEYEYDGSLGDAILPEEPILEPVL